MPAKATSAAMRTKREVIPNAQRREMTRAAVLRAAAEAFDEFGYLAATLDDIVDRANMTKGAVYFHFSSKEDLASEVVALHYERLEEVAASAADDAEDAVAGIVLTTLAAAEAADREVVLRAGMRLALERDVIGSEIEDPYEWWVRVLSTLARKARREGALAPEVSPAAIARTVAIFLLGAYQLARREGLHRQVDTFWRLAEAGIRA